MLRIFMHLLLFLALSMPVYYIHVPSEHEESLSLDEVNLGIHPQLESLINDVVKDGRSKTIDTIHFLTVRLMNDSCGILVKIVAHTRTNLSWYDGYTGFAIVDKIPVTSMRI